LFYEPSTRTKNSFELAAKLLSADVVSVSVATSSVKKGESLKDTVLTLEAMGIEAIVIRHSRNGVQLTCPAFQRLLLLTQVMGSMNIPAKHFWICSPFSNTKDT